MQNRMQRSLLARAWWLALVWVHAAAAAPVDLGTYGPTESVERYRQRVQGIDGKATRYHAQPGKVRVPHAFPIRTPEMTPGRVTPSRHAFTGVQRPLCVVGTDPWSQRWAANRRARLLELGAVCLVVQAKTTQDVEALRATLAPVPTIAASASDLARRLGLTHYPVLLSGEGVEQ